MRQSIVNMIVKIISNSSKLFASIDFVYKSQHTPPILINTKKFLY
eukprot:UN18999